MSYSSWSHERVGHNLATKQEFPGGSDSKDSACNVGDLGSVPRLRRSLGGGHGSPLQYSCLENPMDRGSWQDRHTVCMGSQRDTTQRVVLELVGGLVWGGRKEL